MSSNQTRPGVEWLCVRECLRFSLRHRRYFLIFLMLYWHSLWHWRKARTARYGYCFLQLYDDIMDGDRLTETPPDFIAGQIIAEWERSQFRGDTSLSRLAAALDGSFGELELLPEDDPRRDVLVLLKAMRLDARRLATQTLLNRTELTGQLRATFHHSVNLLLIASQMRTRAEAVPDLVAALSWCSVVRDLGEDLNKGLVNVPADVVRRIEGAGGKFTAQHPEIRTWLDAEKRAAQIHLRNSAATLQQLAMDEPRAARLLGLFQRSIERYANDGRIGFSRTTSVQPKGIPPAGTRLGAEPNPASHPTSHPSTP